MNKFLSIVVLFIFLSGCFAEFWDSLESGSKKINTISNGGQTISTYFSGGYGEVARLGFIGLSNLSLALVALAKHKKAKIAIKTAVESADKTSGGGKALVQTALENGLINDVKETYKKIKETL